MTFRIKIAAGISKTQVGEFRDLLEEVGTKMYPQNLPFPSTHEGLLTFIEILLHRTKTTTELKSFTRLVFTIRIN